MLAQSLQALEQDGFLTVSRIRWCRHMEYSLTPLGEQVKRKVAALADWIELNLPEVLAVRDERCGITAGCAAAYPDYGSWLVGRIRCVSIASANKCRMRLMICRPKRSVLLTQIHLINPKPDIIGRDFIHRILPFLFNKHCGFI